MNSTTINELTELERRRLLPAVMLVLSTKMGARNAITNSDICRNLIADGYEIEGVQVRRIINHIRRNGMLTCLVASPNGYYITGNRTEAMAYVRSLEGRAESILEVARAMKEQAERLEPEEPTLFDDSTHISTII